MVSHAKDLITRRDAPDKTNPQKRKDDMSDTKSDIPFERWFALFQKSCKDAGIRDPIWEDIGMDEMREYYENWMTPDDALYEGWINP